MTRYVPTNDGAAGGLADVEYWNDGSLDRQVAVKFLQRGADHGRLFDEITALQKIQSKHVVQIFDVINWGRPSRMGIVQEYVRGEDLTTLLGKVPVNEFFVRLVYQLATGLADIHRAEVIHRDIKPANIRIDHEGILKIFDFNLSRSFSEGKTQDFVGTRGYAAPELHGTGDVHFTKQVDLYALAITGWALIHGDKLPPELRALPPHPERFKSSTGGFSALTGVDSLLLELLDACLDPDPQSRPHAHEVAGRAARVLLHGKHLALLTDGNGDRYDLSKKEPRVTIKTQLGSMTVGYDGLDFVVEHLSGEVWINNMRLAKGAHLPNCCVIGLGANTLPGWKRAFVTMDVSHPEVVL